MFCFSSKYLVMINLTPLIVLLVTIAAFLRFVVENPEDKFSFGGNQLVKVRFTATSSGNARNETLLY